MNLKGLAGLETESFCLSQIQLQSKKCQCKLLITMQNMKRTSKSKLSFKSVVKKQALKHAKCYKDFKHFLSDHLCVLWSSDFFCLFFVCLQVCFFFLNLSRHLLSAIARDCILQPALTGITHPSDFHPPRAPDSQLMQSLFWPLHGPSQLRPCICKTFEILLSKELLLLSSSQMYFFFSWQHVVLKVNFLFVRF